MGWHSTSCTPRRSLARVDESAAVDNPGTVDNPAESVLAPSPLLSGAPNIGA